MLTPKFLRGQPEWTIAENGVISLLGKSQTYHTVFMDTLQIQPFSTIRLSATFDQHPQGDHPENMHSEAWLGIGPNGEIDPTASSISRIRKWLDWTGIPTQIEIPSVVALGDKATIFLGIEIGVDNQWALASLPSTIRDIHVNVTPPTPEPPPPTLPVFGIMEMHDAGTFFVVTWKIPKVS